MHRDERVSAMNLSQSGAHRSVKVNAAITVTHVPCNQISQHFRVRIRQKLMPIGSELFAQIEIVFDDAIVHQNQLIAIIGVRVGITVGRRAMCRPTRMGNDLTRFRQSI